MMPFQPGIKLQSQQQQQQKHTRKKKKVFGKRNSSYDPRLKSLVPNDRRIPLTIGVEEQNNKNITPKELFVGRKTKNERLGRQYNMEGDSYDGRGENDNNADAGREDRIGTGLSSVTAPTALKDAYSSYALSALARDDNAEEEGSDGISGDEKERGDSYGLNEEELSFNSKNDGGKYSPPLLEKVIGTNKKKEMKVVKDTKKKRTNADMKKKSSRSRDTKMRGSKMHEGKNATSLASTKKRLSYGMADDHMHNNGAALATKKDDEKVKQRAYNPNHRQQHKREPSKKRSRSGEPRGGGDGRINKYHDAAIGKEKAATAVANNSHKTCSFQSQMYKQNDTTTTKSSKKSSKGIGKTQPSQQLQQHTSRRSSYVPSNKRSSIIVRTKSSSYNVNIPNKLSQPDLLKLAKSNNGTAIQFYATNHTGDSILDKNNFGGDKSVKYTIDNGDLIIQQDCANVKGTYWTTKFGFRHWKLPGLRNRGVSMYDSGRPRLIDDSSDQLDDGDKKEDKNGGEVLRRPRLILDTSLSTRHTGMVRKFVKEARVGETPFDFFTDSELSRDGEAQHDDDDENVNNDDFGANGGVTGFSFDDKSFFVEKSEEEEQRPTKRKALGDRSNTANQAQFSIQNTVKTVDKPRTKTARKKRKSSDTQPTLPSTDSSSSRAKRLRTPIQFLVPAFGYDESGGFQDQKHFGLIEGMGGGEEEKERRSSVPHRGRLLELPGAIMPGKWEALVLNDGNNDEEELHSLRLSLRHSSASASSLETYYTGERRIPEGLAISLISPSINRIDGFIKQGVFTDDEIDYYVEGDEKITNDSFLSCLSLSTFGGFLSASESTNDSEVTSKAILARCSNYKGGRPNQHELHKVVGSENDDTEATVLFPCNMSFDTEYSCLISHDDKFRVVAIDVIFRKVEASPQYVGITKSLLNEHQENVGSGVGLIMERFVEQPFKRNYELPDACEKRPKSDNKPDNKHQSESAQIPAKAVVEVLSVHEEEDESEDHAESPGDDLPAARNKKMQNVEEDENEDAELQGDGESEAKNDKQSNDNQQSNSNDLSAGNEVRDNIEATNSDDDFFGGSGCDPFGDGDDLPDELYDEDKSDKQCVGYEQNQRGNKVCNEETAKPNNPVEKKVAQQQKICNNGKVEPMASKKKITAETLTAAYEDFEKNRKTTQLPSVHNSFNGSGALKDDKKKPRTSKNDKSNTKKNVGKVVSNRRLSLNRKVIIVEDDVIDESLLGSRPGRDARRRRNSTGNLDFRKKQDTAMRKNRLSLPSVAVSKKSVKEPKKRQSVAVRTDTSKKPAIKAKTSDRVPSLPTPPKSEPPTRKEKKKSILKSKRRATISQDIPTSKDRLGDSTATKKKKKRVSLNPRLSVAKPKRVEVVDLFGDGDNNSLFGCDVLSYAKTPNSRKDNSRLLEKYTAKRPSLKPSGRTTSLMSKANVSSVEEPKRSVKSRSNHRTTNNTRETGILRNSESLNTSRAKRAENQAVVQSFTEQQNDIQNGSVLRNEVTEDLSVQSTGGSFGSYNHDETETELTEFSYMQPLHDVYYGHESSQTEFCGCSWVAESSIDEHFQPFHDYYIAQESVVTEEGEEEESVCLLHGVYFGLDDNDSNGETELEFCSLINEDETLTQSIYFHDCYYGKEPCIIEDDEEENTQGQENKVGTARIARLNVQSRPLFVMALFAAMLSRAF